MNFNTELYGKTEAKEFGEFETLELGGHEVVILDAREYTSEQTGNTSLKVCVDITGKDKQAGYFKKQYDDNADIQAKWPTGGTRYLSLKDEQIAYLKGFITAIENSNTGFKFDVKGNWDQLKGKRLAAQFGWEEYLGQDGTTKVATKLTQFRSLEKLAEIKIPKVKTLDDTYIDYEEYKQIKANNSINKPSDEIEINDSDLPF